MIGIAIAAATLAASEAPWWGVLIVLVIPIAMVFVIGLIVFGEEILNLIGRRVAQPKSSRMGALEFVERHPALQSLGDQEALTVARVLREELDSSSRRDRRFQWYLMLVGALVGAAIGRLIG